MAQVETTIDSIRVGAVSPERTIILQQKGADHYLPFWVSPSQADILVAQLQGRPDKCIDPDLFREAIRGTLRVALRYSLRDALRHTPK